MPNLIFIPDFKNNYHDLCCFMQNSDANNIINLYIDNCINFTIESFKKPICFESKNYDSAPDLLVKALISRDFNYQSRGKVAHLLPGLLNKFEKCTESGKVIPIYLLYHGGYRASVDPANKHVFSPDVTELLLIYQIAKLHRKLVAIYPPGFSFSIVINNGVAAFTNGIPYARTNGYVEQLRLLIARLGAENSIKVLNQSELGSFEDRMHGIEILPKSSVDQVEHDLVQRFIGRACSVTEACLLVSTYETAERVWGEEIRAIVAAQSGIFCRQIAHPDCLSFRPFPGGAIRVQNGTVGFQLGAAGAVPSFVTPTTMSRSETVMLPMHNALFEGLSPASDSQAAMAYASQ